MGDVINFENAQNVHQLGVVWVTSPQEARLRGFLTLVDWWVAVGAVLVTFVALPVDGFCRITAVGGFLAVSIGLVVVGAAGWGFGVGGGTGAAAGATGTGLTGKIPGEDSGVAGATSVLVSMSGLAAFGWRSWMWSRAHLYWLSLNDLDQVWAIVRLDEVTVAGSQRVLASVSAETVCPAYSRDFGLQWWSWYVALWVAQLLRWSRSAAAWGSLCLMLWGTVVLITLW